MRALNWINALDAANNSKIAHKIFELGKIPQWEEVPFWLARCVVVESKLVYVRIDTNIIKTVQKPIAGLAGTFLYWKRSLPSRSCRYLQQPHHYHLETPAVTVCGGISLFATNSLPEVANGRREYFLVPQLVPGKVQLLRLGGQWKWASARTFHEDGFMLRFWYK